MLDYNDIYKTYHPKLKVLFNKQVNDKDYIDDLIQETLIKVWKNLDSYNDKYSLSTWIYTIAFNTLKNYFKALKDHVSYSAEVYDNEYTVDLDDPQDILIAEEKEKQYLATLDQLDNNFLDVYIMKEVDQLSYKDISTQLGIPEGTVKSRLNRARDYIKKEMI